MLKNQLIKAVSKDAGVPTDSVRKVFDSLSAHIIRCARAGADVFVLGLGKLTVSRRGKKTARNIWTGERVIVPERNVPVLKPSATLTRAVNEPAGE